MVSLVVLAAFVLCGTLFPPPQVAAFKPLFQDGSITHREITQMAILRKTAEVCRDKATAQGRDFTLPVRKRYGSEPTKLAFFLSNKLKMGYYEYQNICD